MLGMPENIKISAENGGFRRLSAVSIVQPPFFSILRVDTFNPEKFLKKIDRYHQKYACYGGPKFLKSKVAWPPPPLIQIQKFSYLNNDMKSLRIIIGYQGYVMKWWDRSTVVGYENLKLKYMTECHSNLNLIWDKNKRK